MWSEAFSKLIDLWNGNDGESGGREQNAVFIACHYSLLILPAMVSGLARASKITFESFQTLYMQIVGCQSQGLRVAVPA